MGCSAVHRPHSPHHEILQWVARPPRSTSVSTKPAARVLSRFVHRQEAPYAGRTCRSSRIFDVRLAVVGEPVNGARHEAAAAHVSGIIADFPDVLRTVPAVEIFGITAPDLNNRPTRVCP